MIDPVDDPEARQALLGLVRGDFGRVVAAMRKHHAFNYSINVDHIVNMTGLAKTDVVALLKKLQSIGVGEFVVGRHGHSSRFLWRYTPESVVEVAMQKAQRFDMLDASVGARARSVAPQLMVHSFQLREGVQAAFQLPADLTEKEAERLALFIKSLPF